MGIRKITFDNGDIVLAKDQAILYDLLLKQQTKTIFPNGETIYQNSTGFLIQNESEKLQYTYKTTDNGVEFTFNPQLYLSVCGRIIKLEKNTKLLVDKNYVENNENYYIAVRVDLNKEAKIINSELKEFGNPVEIKIINTVSMLIQENLNQKPNDGIYEFPLISFKVKFKHDIYAIEDIKNESTYLLPLLLESSRNPLKLLTITKKIQEEKELLQEKQNQIKDVKNYLTNLEYRKTEELEELENLMKELIKIDKNSRPQIPENSNWKLLIEGKNEEINHILKTYIGLKLIGKTWFINTWKGKQLKPDTWKIFGISSIYRWDGVGEPEKPTVNPNTGEITDWK